MRIMFETTAAAQLVGAGLSSRAAQPGDTMCEHLALGCTLYVHVARKACLEARKTPPRKRKAFGPLDANQQVLRDACVSQGCGFADCIFMPWGNINARARAPLRVQEA